MDWFLALDVIRPGDILLTAEPKRPSYAIRAATFSRVSHAILALHPLIWFEAVRNGVGYRVVQPELVWDGKSVRLGLKIKKGERYIVKRLKDDLPYSPNDPGQTHRFARRLIESTTYFAFWDYAQADQFLSVIRLRLGQLGVVRYLAKKLAAKLAPSPVALYRGPFCSWLVAYCYDTVGLKFFNGAPDALTPRALDRSKKLREIDCVILAEPLKIASHLERFDEDLHLTVKSTSMTLDTLFTAADGTKTIRRSNASLRAIKEQGRGLFAHKIPDGLPDALALHDEQMERYFRSWQTQAHNAVTNGYRRISARTEAVSLLAPCRQNCAENNLPACTLMCRRLSARSHEVRKTVDEAFVPGDEAEVSGLPPLLRS